MPEVSDPEWDQLDELGGYAPSVVFHALPGDGNRWHVPAEELLRAVEHCRASGAEQAKKALLR